MPEHSRRLFFALWPGPEVRTALREAMTSVGIESLGRLVHRADLHATLVFLGSVDAEHLPCVTESARAVANRAGFEVVIDHLAYWRRPRVIWAGARETPEGLPELVSDLKERLRACGFDPETRPYRFHITLARKARACKVSDLPRPIRWSAWDLALVESVAIPGKKNRYEVVNKWHLGS